MLVCLYLRTFKRILPLVFTLWLFLFLPSIPASSTVYYVSSSYGKDTNDGKTKATAWKTIAKINSKTFSPGDSILFNKGDVWRETLTIPSSGNSTKYIVFSSYGSGVNPRILGSTKIVKWINKGGCIWRSSVEVSNPYKIHYPSEIFFIDTNDSTYWGTHVLGTGSLAAEYNWTWSSNFIYVYASTDPGSRYSAVEVPQRDFSIHLNSQEYIEINGIDMFYDMNAGVVEQYPTAGLYGYILRNCEIAYNGTLTGVGFGTHVLYNNSLIEKNVFHDCGRRAVSINHYGTTLITNVVIQNNIFRNGNHTNGIDLSIGGAGNSGSIDSVIIRRNLFYQDPNETVKYANDVYLQKYSNGGNTLKGVYIYSNIFRNPTGSSILVERADESYIYNNTFYGMNQKRSDNIFFVCFTQSSLNGIVKNNIFYGNSSSSTALCLYVENTSDYKQVTANNNLYYQTSSNAPIIEIGSTGKKYYSSDISLVRSGLGWETQSPTPANPMFESSTDYHLQSSSPAIGAGVAIASVDMDYEQVAYGNPPNIGCYATPVTSENPVYVSSVIENATASILTMKYNQYLASIVPEVSAFKVMVNGVERSITSVSVSGTNVILTLSSAVAYGDVVTVAYTVPASNPIQSTTGNLAANLSAKSVTNNVVSTVPVYINSSVEDATPTIITMTYSLALTNIIPPTSAFTVMVNGVARTVTSVSVTSTNVILTLSNPIVYGDVVMVSYIVPSSNPLQTSGGIKAASITAQSVTNNIISPGPTYVSSVIENATPSLLTLTYSLALANVIPSASAFTVTVNNVIRSVTTVAISGVYVLLTLSSSVTNGDVVKVSYLVPTSNPLQSSSGTLAESLTSQLVTNNVNPLIPTYVSSMIENATPSKLTITYSLVLASIIPETSSFTVIVNGIARSVTSVSISGSTVILTLANAVSYGDIVTVAYTAPSSNPLQTSSGRLAASMSAKSVTNNVNAPALTYVSSVVDNVTPSLLTMSFSASLANIVPAASAFTVLVNGVARTVTTVTISGKNVVLTLSSAVAYGDVITVSYTKPARNPLQTSGGITAAGINNQPVINNVNPATPSFVSAVVNNSTPSQVTMTYNQTLANIVPASSAFTLTVNGVTRSISTVGISGTTVLLNITTPVVYGDVITIAYTKPSLNPLQNSSGVQAVNLSAQNVTNNVSASNPTFVSAVIENSTPAVLTMTYNLTLANIIPATSAFVVRVNNVVRSVTNVVVSGNYVVLTLSSAVVYGDVVTVTYIRPYTNPLQTPAGKKASTIYFKNVTNHVNAVVQVNPLYVSSAIENSTPSTLTMTYSLSLANIVPSVSAFTVAVNSTVRNVTKVVVSGTNVVLTLSTAVVYGDVVTISYTQPSSNQLQTSTGGKAASISNQPVNNNVNLVNPDNPVYVSSVIHNSAPNLLDITFSLSMTGITPNVSAFVVKVNSTIVSINSISVSGTDVVLTLANQVYAGDIITVSYTKPASNPLQTSTGGQATSFTAQNVNNEVTTVNDVTPSYIGSTVENATPSLLTITYDLNLANITPAISTFEVKVNAIDRTISRMSVSGKKVVLTLSSPVVYGDIVTVSYTVPSTNQIQSLSGKAVSGFIDKPVTNNVSFLNSPPIISLNYDADVYSGFVSDIDATETYDPDNDSLNYTWTAPVNIEVSTLSGQTLSFLAPIVKTDTTMQFELNVSDGVDVSSQIVSITVHPYKPELASAVFTAVTASDYYGTNYPLNANDNNLTTQWASDGPDRWITFETQNPFDADYFEVAFQKGHTLSSYFDFYVSNDGNDWIHILSNIVSCDFASGFQVFDVSGEIKNHGYKFFRIIGHGNEEDSWNIYSEFKLFGRVHYDEVKMNIFPNPASDIVNISLKYPTESLTGEPIVTSSVLRFFDSTGNIALVKKVEAGVTDLQIPISFKNGFYIVQMTSGNLTISAGKLIVVH